MTHFQCCHRPELVPENWTFSRTFIFPELFRNFSIFWNFQIFKNVLKLKFLVITYKTSKKFFFQQLNTNFVFVLWWNLNWKVARYMVITKNYGYIRFRKTLKKLELLGNFQNIFWNFSALFCGNTAHFDPWVEKKNIAVSLQV